MHKSLLAILILALFSAACYAAVVERLPYRDSVYFAIPDDIDTIEVDVSGFQWFIMNSCNVGFFLSTMSLLMATKRGALVILGLVFHGIRSIMLTLMMGAPWFRSTSFSPRWARAFLWLNLICLPLQFGIMFFFTLTMFGVGAAAILSMFTQLRNKIVVAAGAIAVWILWLPVGTMFVMSVGFAMFPVMCRLFYLRRARTSTAIRVLTHRARRGYDHVLPRVDDSSAAQSMSLCMAGVLALLSVVAIL